MTKQQLWELWERLWNERNTEVEYDEQTMQVLEQFAAEVGKRAVSATLDQALNSGDGSYRP